MYICENCLARFERAVEVFERIDRYGGEYHSVCPRCRAPAYYQREEEYCGKKQNDPEWILGG